MADSNYYRRLYNQKKEATRNYDNNLIDLRRILSNLTDNLYDEISNINNEIDDLKGDLYKGVRHNVDFTAQATTLEIRKEKSVTADPYLSGAANEIQEEITRIANLRNQAAYDSENYYGKYKGKKEEERQASLGKRM